METLQWIVSMGISISQATLIEEELSRLRDSLPKAHLLINRGEWGRFKNEGLAKLLLQLRDTTYDAEDLLRKFEDQEHWQKREDADRSRTGQLLSSAVNLAKQFILRSKKGVKMTQDKLDKIVADVEGMLNSMGIHDDPVQLMPETTSIIGASEVFGRDEERDELIEMLVGRENKIDQVMKQLGVPFTRGGTSRSAGSKGKGAAAGNSVASASRSAKRLKGDSSRAGVAETNCTGNVSVLPIYGIGGVGKTTLAQLIYNDPRVTRHFGLTIWVCVSDLFDKRRMTKEIIESIPGEEFNPSCSLNALQVELMKRLNDQKFLLVLDDIWPIPDSEWDAFYAPLRHGFEGSMILVTTRYPVVANHVTTSNCKPVQLEGLPTDIFWEFFRKCAFGKNDAESYPHLQDIGQSISSRLCGSPFAAKTLGRLLSMELTERHWRTVQNSELWELPHQETEILPALQLSYLYLPQELKRCFAFCSMFPKDYSFRRDEIVDIWVAEGFVAPSGRMRLEDVGNIYLDDLRSRFLFQADPKFPQADRYVMHDLIHDMAQSVSVDECFLMHDLSQRRMVRTVRHMSVEVDGESLSRMIDIQHLNKLHSLRFGTRFDFEITWFNQLSNILFLSLKGSMLVKLPESICELNSLRYLEISGSRVEELPDKLWRLHNLQVLDARRSSLKTIHQDITKLINLRHLALPSLSCEAALSRVSGLGNLSCLRKLSEFRVGKENGRRISELKFMNELSGKLYIRNICNVRSKDEAAEARLVDKQYLKDLKLIWRDNYTVGSGSGDNEVVEGLRPHSRIESLRVHGFRHDRFSPSWFKPENLPNLRKLELSSCPCLKSVSIPSLADGTQASSTGFDRTQEASSSISCRNSIASFALTRLTTLWFQSCENLTNLNQFLFPENLPSVKSIQLVYCHNLVSIPAHSFVGFACLQDLKIHGCVKLVCPREMLLPPSLRRLSVVGCGELEKSFPACLENLTSLMLLQLVQCCNIESIPLDSITGTNMLKCLLLDGCQELSSIGGSDSLSSIQHVEIDRCPKLKELEQLRSKKELEQPLPFKKGGLRCKKLHDFFEVFEEAVTCVS
ncbi:disease resistance protein RGA2-like [Phragmites australis]|uniref:disease resistance protein RGA2-like n=1 Tax=Phragmites australis TaxID=29695 RepID=UPI002D7985F1|nr:disease resistance protein RGA2-like [Phragmites australis]